MTPMGVMIVADPVKETADSRFSPVNTGLSRGYMKM